MKKRKIIRHSFLGEIVDPAHSCFLPHFSVFSVDVSMNVHTNHSLFDEGSRSDFFSILFIKQGKASLKINTELVELTAGVLLSASPNQLKQFISSSPDCLMVGVTFTADFFKDTNQPANIMQLLDFFISKQMHPWLISQKEQAIFLKCTEQLSHRAENISSHLFGQELLGVAFSEFLYEMADFASRHQYAPSISFGRKEYLVHRFTKLVTQHYLTERSVGFYASRLYVSGKYLSETAKEVTGKTAGEIIDEVNLMEAKRLLENSVESVSDIAYTLNFSSPAFFSKFFKRLTGQSPKLYRHSVLKNQRQPS